MTKEELIQIFRQETEDLVKKNVEIMFNIKSWSTNLAPGNNPFSFAGNNYDYTDYIITIVTAIDSEGIDVRGEIDIDISNKTVSGFILNSINPCTVKVTTMRTRPKAEYFTNG